MDNDHTTLSQNNAAKNGQRVSVLLPLGIDKAYDYMMPYGKEVVDSSYVKVPFGHRVVTGVIWHKTHDNATSELDSEHLKVIVYQYEAPPMPRPLRIYCFKKRGSIANGNECASRTRAKKSSPILCDRRAAS